MRDSKSIPLLVLLLIILWSSGSMGESLRGKGDFEFFISVSSLPAENAGTLALFQIAIPVKEIKYRKKNGEYRASLAVAIALESADQMTCGREYKVTDRRKEEKHSKDFSEFFFVTDSCFVNPGEYSLKVKVEDLNRSKKTLFGIITGENFSSQVKDVYVQIPSYRPNMISLSDPVFIWSRGKEDRFVANPMRIYGLRNDSLSFYIKGVVPPEFKPDSLGLHVSILTGKGELMAERSLFSSLKDNLVEFFDVFDLNRYTAGEYRVVAEVIGHENSISYGDFNVVWELINWQRPRRDLLVEARILLSDSGFEKFRRAGLGEQEKTMDEFWKKIDPTPHTAVNEKYEKFVSRIEYADRHFKGLKRRGALTDRGQVYIRFGPPDGIETEDVPRNRDDLAMAMEKLEDQYQIIIHSITNPTMKYTEVRPQILRGAVNPFRGNEGFDSGAYELWLYNINGDPIVGRDELLTVKSGLRFLFVDVNGVGNYILVGTSEDMKE